MIYELLGILATLITLTSFLMNGELKIRKVNLVGSVLFAVYGILISAFSVYLLNGIIAIVQVYKIYKIRRINNEEQ